MKQWLWCLCLGLSVGLSAGEWDTTLNNDTYLGWDQQPFLGQGDTLLSSRIRLNTTYYLSDHWHWKLAYEVAQYRRKNLAPIFAPIWLRADDFPLVVDESDNQALLHRLDRFQITYEGNGWNFTLGRQAVGHGSGRFFNPSDIFAPLSPFTLNTQYKSGIDGIRMGKTLGTLGEIELMGFFPEQGEGVYLARLANTFGNVDASLLMGQTYGEWTLAWDLAGTLAGASWFTEGIWRQGEQRDDTWRLAAGFSRRLAPKLDFTLESHYHNLDIENPYDLLTTPEVLRGELFLLNEHHVAMSLSYEAHALVSVSATVMAETKDQSAWIQLGLGWDVSQRATLGAGYLHTEGGPLTEYGSREDTAFMELRLTFP